MMRVQDIHDAAQVVCANDDNSDKNTSIAMTSASIKFIKFIMPIMFTLRAATPQIPGGKN